VLRLGCENDKKTQREVEIQTALFTSDMCVAFTIKYTTPAHLLYSVRMLSRLTTAVLGTCEANCPSARLREREKHATRG